MPLNLSPRLRAHYMLGLLTLGFMLNSLDRSIVSVMLEPIRLEFGATDTQLGLLSGLTFAVVFTLCSLPIAGLADRGNRRNVLAAGMLLWSLMTAVSGLVPGFMWLLLARMGVAAGEAAGTPVSHALITDLYPRDQRATALALYGVGAPAGGALAGLLGGYGMEALGWRMTLMVAAIPGLVLATVLLLTTDEPPRAGPPAAREDAGSWLTTVRELMPSRVYRHLWIGCALHSVALFAVGSFNAAFLMRALGWAPARTGELIALVGVAGAVGTFGGGWLADALARRTGDRRWVLRVATLSTLATVPLQAAAYTGFGNAAVPVLLVLASASAYAFLGPAYAAAQSVSPPHMRARAAAMLVLAITIVGMGVGPVLAGVVSDALSPNLGGDALHYALLIAPAANLWSALHLHIASRGHPA